MGNFFKIHFLSNKNLLFSEEIKPEDNQTVTGLLIQLADDLKRKNEYHAFELMSEQKKRTELLLMLHDRIFNRRQKVYNFLFDSNF